MTDKDDGQQFKRRRLNYLNEILLEIQSLEDHVYILGDEELAALHMRKAEPAWH